MRLEWAGWEQKWEDRKMPAFAEAAALVAVGVGLTLTGEVTKER